MGLLRDTTHEELFATLLDRADDHTSSVLGRHHRSHYRARAARTRRSVIRARRTRLIALGVDERRTDHQDIHATIANLTAKRLEESVQGVFRRRIGTASEERCKARDAREHDDLPSPIEDIR